MDDFIRNLTSALLREGITQAELSRRTGISDSKISSYLRGRYKPNGETLSKIASVLHVSPAWLIGQETARASAPSGYGIPLIGKVAAGSPIFAQENVVGHLPADAPSGDLFALSVSGDSMSPRILDGDVVIVKRQEAAEDGDVVIALVNDEATCKVFRRSAWGVTLVPFNPAFQPLVFAGGEASELRILGVVVESRHKWR